MSSSTPENEIAATLAMSDLPSPLSVRRRSATAEVVHEEYVVVLALDRNDCEPLAIAGSAMVIWQTLTASFQPLSTVTRTIAERVGVASTDIESDIAQFVSTLVDRDIAELASVTIEGATPADHEHTGGS